MRRAWVGPAVAAAIVVPVYIIGQAFGVEALLAILIALEVTRD